jgi:gamma-glutamyl-gamma-aminobutyrate hydrolase PuuD
MKIGITYNQTIKVFEDEFNQKIDLLTEKSKFADYDLIIIPDGPDPSPKSFGFTNNYSNPDTTRDSIEMPIVKAIYNTNPRPKILGIGRGLLLTVLLSGTGGRLIQDLGIEAGKPHEKIHPIEVIKKDSIVFKSFNGINVISRHHNGFMSGDFSNVTSKYKDVVESLESRKSILVMFRPELSDDAKSKLEFFKLVKEWAIQKETPTTKVEGELNAEELMAFMKNIIMEAEAGQ